MSLILLYYDSVTDVPLSLILSDYISIHLSLILLDYIYVTDPVKLKLWY